MKGPIARGTIRTTFILALYTLVQAVTLLLVARMFGPHKFGAFAGIASLAVFLGTLSPFGTHIVLLGEVAKAPERRDSVLVHAIPTTLFCGGALLLVYLVTCTLILSAAAVPIGVIVAIGATEIWLQALFRLTVSEHQGLGRIARSQLLKILPAMLRLILACGVFVLRPPDPLLVYGGIYPMASLLAILLAAQTLPARWPGPRRWRLPEHRELRANAGYAVLGITASGPGELDKTLATRLLPLSAAGIYAVGTRIISSTILPISAMMESALPRLFRDGSGQPERTRRLLGWIFGTALLYSLAIAIVLWLTAPVFEWLFGTTYHDLSHTVRWLCLALPAIALRMSMGSILMALGRPWVRAGFEILGVTVLMITSVPLAHRFGTPGMSLALACSEWAMTAIGGASIKTLLRGSRRHRSPPTD